MATAGCCRATATGMAGQKLQCIKSQTRDCHTGLLRSHVTDAVVRQCSSMDDIVQRPHLNINASNWHGCTTASTFFTFTTSTSSPPHTAQTSPARARLADAHRIDGILQRTLRTRTRPSHRHRHRRRRLLLPPTSSCRNIMCYEPRGLWYVGLIRTSNSFSSVNVLIDC